MSSVRGCPVPACDSKRRQGRYYTAGETNPFALRAFRAWAREAGLPRRRLLEPFAGRGDLLQKLEEVGLLGAASAFDIAPATKGVSKKVIKKVKRRDTLENFPQGYQVCVTNPPWLARNSASLRGLPFPVCAYDDLYKHALEQCLANCAYVAALVPESFIRSFARSSLFRARLHSFVSLTGALFVETAHPVGLAMFSPRLENDIALYRNDLCLGGYQELQHCLPLLRKKKMMRFNDGRGELGLFALDNTKEASIRFCDIEEVRGYKIGVSSRAITMIKIDERVTRQFLNNINDVLNSFRDRTHDIFLTAYRGLRKDGMYRRRLDWGLAKHIIEVV